MAIQNKTLGKHGFDNFIQNQQKIIHLERTISNIVEKVALVHEAIASNILKAPEKEKEIKQIFTERLTLLEAKKEDMVNNYF